MTVPSASNLTIPGGITLFFDEGGGMKDLGHFDPYDLGMRTASEELKVETQRSGKLRLLDTFPISEEVEFTFAMMEPVIQHLRYYFKGGDITAVGAGTANITDQKLTLTGELLQSVGKYGISAVTVRQFLDACLKYDGSAYTDHTAEADSLAGTPFNLLEDASDYVYFGKNSLFKEIYLDLAMNGSYTGVGWEYWDGAAWQALTAAGAGLNLDADGKVNWTPPNDWAKTTVNSVGPYYWVRVKCTAVTTVATANCVRQNAVQLTDYIVDPGQASGDLLVGRIGRLAAGFLAAGEEVKVSYTYTTWTSLTMPLATTAFKEGSARLQFHPSTGLQGNFHIHRCQLKPRGDLNFDPKKQLNVPMSLVVLDDYDNHPDSPYGYWEALSEAT